MDCCNPDGHAHGGAEDAEHRDEDPGDLNAAEDLRPVCICPASIAYCRIMAFCAFSPSLIRLPFLS